MTRERRNMSSHENSKRFLFKSRVNHTAKKKLSTVMWRATFMISIHLIVDNKSAAKLFVSDSSQVVMRDYHKPNLGTKRIARLEGSVQRNKYINGTKSLFLTRCAERWPPPLTISSRSTSHIYTSCVSVAKCILSVIESVTMRNGRLMIWGARIKSEGWRSTY